MLDRLCIYHASTPREGKISANIECGYYSWRGWLLEVVLVHQQMPKRALTEKAQCPRCAKLVPYLKGAILIDPCFFYIFAETCIEQTSLKLDHDAKNKQGHKSNSSRYAAARPTRLVFYVEKPRRR
jgi:hypothetical protein